MSSKARSSAAVKGEKPLRKRKKKMPSPSPSPVIEEPTSIMSLPYDLLFNCFARVSRLYYPTLSLVSKTFRSIVASLELYEIRSRLNRTEKCLYLCFRFPFETNTHWLTLCRKPNQNVTNKSSGYSLVKIPSPNGLLPTQSSRVIAVGSNIYQIGGSNSLRFKIGTRYSSCVSVLDCRDHRWRQAPNMRVKRSYASTVCEVDGKIYVAGGCKADTCSLYFMEVFDPKTQTWGIVKNPSNEYQNEFGSTRLVKSLGLDGKLYMFGCDSSVYNFEEDRWYDIGVHRTLRRAIDSRSCVDFSSCVIDNVSFIWDKGTQVFKWYDFKVSLWKDLNGVEGLPDLRDREYCKMVDLGGKMAVLWEESLCKENRIWCAEISLERRDGDEMWGKVEWFDVVLRVHESGSLEFSDVLSATV